MFLYSIPAHYALLLPDVPWWLSLVPLGSGFTVKMTGQAEARSNHERPAGEKRPVSTCRSSLREPSKERVCSFWAVRQGIPWSPHPHKRFSAQQENGSISTTAELEPFDWLESRVRTGTGSSFWPVPTKQPRSQRRGRHEHGGAGKELEHPCENF